MANEPLKVQQPFLKRSSEIKKITVYNQNRTFSSRQSNRDGDKFSFSRISSDGEFELTEGWSAKILVEEAQKCKTFLREAPEKNPEISIQKIFEYL